MNPRDVRKFLFDVQRACTLTTDFTRGVSKEAFLSNELLQSAVERQLMIAGEALRQALDLDASLADVVTDTRLIIAFRNRLAHGYSDILPDVVWGIAQNDVPRLLEEVRLALARLS
jgi:uncharacterized protein with HEPN domain